MEKYIKKRPLSSQDVLEKILGCDTYGTVKTITLQVTEDCCLKCSYCYQKNKSKNKMTFDVAKKFIDNLLNNKIDCCTTDRVKGLIINFIGGEPLMQIDLIEQVVEYTVTQMALTQHPWLFYTYFGIDTNGMLYNTEKVQNFLKKYSKMVFLGFSVDGNKELHDSCRIDLNGNGSYDTVLKNFKKYREDFKGGSETKMTLSPENIKYTKDALINLMNENFESINFNCQYEEGWTLEHAKILYHQLRETADYVIENELYGKHFISMFDEELFHPYEENDAENNWCGGVDANMLAIDYKGDYYTCIRYMNSSLNNEQKPLILGNIYNGWQTTDEEKANLAASSNITRRSQSTDECYYCPVAAGCGWCSAFNYQKFGTVNKRATYICLMHKARALANVYYWNKLYEHIGLDKKFICYLKQKDIDLILDREEDINDKLYITRFKEGNC